MKITKKILIILIIISTLFSGLIYTMPVQAANSDKTQPTSNTITKPSSAPAPDFTISSEGAVLIDSTSGKILYGKNENKKLYPASTTKIITAILAIEHCKPTDKITASYDAVMSIPSGYSNAAIQPGETLDFKDLLDMFLIHSANEIGNIFAEHVSGSVENFAKLMNQKAAEIGCKHTHFTNPSGIHDVEHYSTAYDMALIAQYCMKNQVFRNTVAKTSCTVEATDKYEERYFKNTNDLLNKKSNYYYEYAIGTKTGYTSQAKRCLIATSLKDNIELITVTLGAQSGNTDTRYQDTINLFEYGYSNYKIETIATKDTKIEEIVIGNATNSTKNLSLLIKDDLKGLVPTSSKLVNLDPTVKLNDLIAAPINEGDVLGTVTYKIGDFEYSADLVAAHSVEELNVKLMLSQIALALLVVFILSKLITSKKKLKKKSKKKKNYKNKKSGSNKNSIYKF